MMTEHRKNTEKYVSPDELYATQLDSWELLWDKNKSLYENILYLVSNAVFLPQPKLLNPLVAIYLLMPSKWSKVAGILFSFGDQGSGKSTIATLANFIHGLKYTFSPTDTFASIRNALDTMRWVDPASKDYEKEGSILCWDNLHIDTLRQDKKIYQLLLFGYNRMTDKIQIATSNGANQEFHVFSPKIISSIEPIHLHHEFAELKRRLIVVPHKRWEKFTADERKHYDGVDINFDRVELDAFSWRGIERHYYEFWANVSNYTTYVGWRKILTQKGKKGFTIPPAITSEKWTITIDLIATAMTLGVWHDVQNAINYFAEYWEYSDNHIYGEHNATMEHLRQFIEEETATIKELNEKLALAGGRAHKVIISPKKLKDRLAVLQAEGSLDITPKTKDITNLMWLLGWKLSTKGWIER